MVNVFIAGETLAPSTAQTLELLGDDGDGSEGFLRSTGAQDDYVLVVDPERLQKHSEYYFAFRRFAQTFFTQPATRELPAANKLREFADQHQITVISTHVPERLDSALTAQPLPPLKVITINAEWFITHVVNSTDPAARFPALLDWIKQQDADIIVIQEILGDWFARLLSQLTSYHGHHFHYPGYFHTSELGILSKHPITQAIYYPQTWATSWQRYCYIGPSLRAYMGFGFATIDFHGTPVVVGTNHAVVTDPSGAAGPSTFFSSEQRSFVDADAWSAERKMVYVDIWRTMAPLLDRVPVIYAADLNVAHGHGEYGFWRQLTGMNDGLLDSLNGGVTDYEAPNHGRQCERPHAFETFSHCNRRVAAAEEGSLGVLDYIFTNHFVKNLYTYIDKSTDTFSDHFAVVGRYRIARRPGHIRLPLRQPLPSKPPPIPRQHLDDLRAYFDAVNVHFLCGRSDYPQSQWQQRRTLRVLDHLLSLY